MDLSSISNTHTATSHRLHPFHRLRSLSPRALGINTTVSRNPKSSATSFPILTCSGRKQVYSALHLQRALLFLNYYQKKNVSGCSHMPSLSWLCRGKAKWMSFFPSGNSLSSWEKKHRSKYLESLICRKLDWSGLTQLPTVETANVWKNNVHWPPLLQSPNIGQRCWLGWGANPGAQFCFVLFSFNLMTTSENSARTLSHWKIFFMFYFVSNILCIFLLSGRDRKF